MTWAELRKLIFLVLGLGLYMLVSSRLNYLDIPTEAEIIAECLANQPGDVEVAEWADFCEGD